MGKWYVPVMLAGSVLAAAAVGVAQTPTVRTMPATPPQSSITISPEVRIADLEKQLKAANQSIEGLNIAIGGLAKDIVALKAQLGTQTTTVAALKKSYGSHSHYYADVAPTADGKTQINPMTTELATEFCVIKDPAAKHLGRYECKPPA